MHSSFFPKSTPQPAHYHSAYNKRTDKNAAHESDAPQALGPPVVRLGAAATAAAPPPCHAVAAGCCCQRGRYWRL
jgi:hypothetical protein